MNSPVCDLLSTAVSVSHVHCELYLWWAIRRIMLKFHFRCVWWNRVQTRHVRDSRLNILIGAIYLECDDWASPLPPLFCVKWCDDGGCCDCWDCVDDCCCCSGCCCCCCCCCGGLSRSLLMLVLWLVIELLLLTAFSTSPLLLLLKKSIVFVSPPMLLNLS